MGNWQPWVYPGHWSVAEHNAVLAELRKAEAELDRMGKANNEACDRIAELEAQLAAVAAERDDLRRQLAARATRPVKVRWGVTVKDATEAFQKQRWDWKPAETELAMSFLLNKVVIDVPPGMPTLDDLASAYLGAVSEGSDVLLDGVAAIYHRLAPYLNPPLQLPDREALAMFRELNATAPGECQQCAQHKKRIHDLETAVDCAHEFLSGVIRRAALEGEV